MGYYSSLYLSKNSGDSNTKNKPIFNNTLSAPGGKELGGKVIAEPAGGNGASSSGGSYADGGYSGGGSTSGAGDQYNAYERYYSDLAASERKARQREINQAVNRLKQQIPQIEQEAEDAVRQANINKMLALRDMPQQLAAMGSSGGMTDSAVLGLNTSYENSRNSIIRDRDKAIQNVQNNIADVRASGNAALAEAENEYRQALAQKALELGLYQQENAQRLNTALSARGGDAEARRKNALRILDKYGVDDDGAAEIFSLLDLD